MLATIENFGIYRGFVEILHPVLRSFMGLRPGQVSVGSFVGTGMSSCFDSTARRQTQFGHIRSYPNTTCTAAVPIRCTDPPQGGAS